MSLKYDRIEYLLLDKDIADAVEDLKNGKRKSKSNLYKFVVFRRMSKEDYKEIVERYYKVNARNKKYTVCLWGHPIREFIPIIFNLSIYLALYILLNEINTDNLLNIISLLYLGCAFSLYYCFATREKEDKASEIAALKREIRNLESIRESDKDIIELLKKQLEITKHNSD